jgi:hypothetical protein
LTFVFVFAVGSYAFQAEGAGGSLFRTLTCGYAASAFKAARLVKKEKFSNLANVNNGYFPYYLLALSHIKSQ